MAYQTAVLDRHYLRDAPTDSKQSNLFRLLAFQAL